MNLLKSIIVGFIAGVTAAVTVQEFVSWLFIRYWTGWNADPWSLESVRNLVIPDLYLPWLASAALTGGLWGALFGLILGWKPQGMMTIRGAILGFFGPGLLGAMVAVPYLTQSASPFFNGDVEKIVPMFCIATAFGAAAAWIYGLFSWGRLPC